MNSLNAAVSASPIDLFIFLAFALVLLAIAAFSIIRASAINLEPTQSGDSEIYKAQLQELAQNFDAGQIDKGEFESGRIEIGRRIVRAQRLHTSAPLRQTSPKGNKALISALLFGIFASLLYIWVGNPFMHDLPYKAREKAILSASPETLSQEEILVLLQNRAKERPADAIPHLLMGSIMKDQGRLDEALRAFQAVLRRDNKNAEALAQMASTMFALNEFKTDSQIIGALNAALSIEPDNLSANFTKGQIAWREENQAQAMQIWQNLWQGYGAQDIRRYGLISRVIEEISKLNVGPGSSSGGPMAQMAQDMAGGANANPQAMINTMLSRRANKLADNPQDLGLRFSLARANIMAKNPQNGLQILVDGRKYHSNNPFQMAVLNQTIEMMGTPSEDQKGKTE